MGPDRDRTRDTLPTALSSITPNMVLFKLCIFEGSVLLKDQFYNLICLCHLFWSVGPLVLVNYLKEHLAIRRIFSLVDMITNTKFSNCPSVFEIGIVWQ